MLQARATGAPRKPGWHSRAEPSALRARSLHSPRCRRHLLPPPAPLCFCSCAPPALAAPRGGGHGPQPGGAGPGQRGGAGAGGGAVSVRARVRRVLAPGLGKWLTPAFLSLFLSLPLSPVPPLADQAAPVGNATVTLSNVSWQHWIQWYGNSFSPCAFARGRAQPGLLPAPVWGRAHKNLNPNVSPGPAR